ncbi:FMN-binding protein [Spirochaeta cellobiosiphila]|uniref:FMN-binding protein n=1 Tax=Spirochaeta cellobiosiphila TaxID=504483 RepID=UPI00040017F4|nr:FMN-binding protein [Spirochaeta cellobiosiphila]
MTKLKHLYFPIVLFWFLISCHSKEVRTTRNLPIEPINIAQLVDGNYLGQYTYGSFTYEVEVTVRDKRIVYIDITNNRNTMYARKAEIVIRDIISTQNNAVDAVSGATTTSKALLKAIERALSNGYYNS